MLVPFIGLGRAPYGPNPGGFRNRLTTPLPGWSERARGSLSTGTPQSFRQETSIGGSSFVRTRVARSRRAPRASDEESDQRPERSHYWEPKTSRRICGWSRSRRTRIAPRTETSPRRSRIRQMTDDVEKERDEENSDQRRASCINKPNPPAAHGCAGRVQPPTLATMLLIAPVERCAA